MFIRKLERKLPCISFSGKLAGSFVLSQGSDRSPGRQARGRPARNPRGAGAGNVEHQGQTGGRGGV